ncbi:PepSY domain-containing protein [Streptomyces sp. ID01-12c]|uniref:PepSY domain-containing protein n=1 Tax=Streptomyces caniscabiei TaxID=2746961 RepID=A0A927L9R9_9ACTN|nr:PepSY domain-containing protein [Streptomyces caniscabiei]MBD9704446.1 PepSY domain-containing protein [Streptomyces caniscabiei]MBD9726684.1 PepSY domain-containing protein [Streptomyces caniscabiei]MDX3514753.1 PepSY domain-containing protein [Streptomyces caniscabiei]MDX3723726.1 PepSY domain-containing protein [Streptomyces caniscabiei]MDX3731350.1 PepSY domain-containing protein [Streptomyces caniscabiei]
MKRNIVIATITAVALIGGGTATAIAVSGDDEAPAKKTVSVSNDNDRDDANDVNDDSDDTAQDKADDKAEDRAARDTDQDADDKAENAAEAKAGQVTAADAIATALKSKAGTAVSADLDDEGTNLVWDVDVLTAGDKWFSVQVDPSTGKVLGTHADRDDDGDDAAETAQIRAALKGSSVTAAEAAEAAADKGTVTSVDLDEESADQAWEVDTTAADGTGSDWRVNLDSGKLTADRTED